MGFRMLVVVATVIGIVALVAVQKASADPGYVIQEGDTLEGIAIRLGLPPDRAYLVYDTNAAVIDDAARAFGHADSNQGDLLIPGTVLAMAGTSSDAQLADPAPAPLIEVNEGIPYPWDFVTIVVLFVALIATIVGGVGYLIHLSRSTTRPTTD